MSGERIAATVLVLVFQAGLMAEDNITEIHEDFTHNPKWDSHNNRPDPSVCTMKVQNFGYSPTAHAGGYTGEIGGIISRSLTPASYTCKIPVRTLKDPLRASGRFSVTASSSNSGAMVGWFNHNSRGWRTPNSLVFRIDTEEDKFRVLFEYGTQTWKTGGGQTFAGPYQTTLTPLFKSDGSSHEWALVYKPDGGDDAGEIDFMLDSKLYNCTLGKGHKDEGAVFDRFGIMNVQTSGQSLSLWLDDLELNGKKESFTTDPGWEVQGNHISFQDCHVRPYHDFGWFESSHAGGKPGEIGGLIWRNESFEPKYAGYYGTPVGDLSLGLELRASGKVCLRTGAADSAVLLGWFNSLTPIGAAPPNFLGILIEGPSAVGHYVRPICRNSLDQQKTLDKGPILRPDDKPHEWKLLFEPAGAEGRGRITMALDDRKVEMDLDEGMRKSGAAFDHFGLVSWNTGGHYVEIFFDDLTFTAAKHAK